MFIVGRPTLNAVRPVRDTLAVSTQPAAMAQVPTTFYFVDSLNVGAQNMRKTEPPAAAAAGPASTSSAGGRIRTLSVSLLAAAAIAASVLLARQRQEKTAPTSAVPAGESAPAEQSLDAIRAAGL